MIIFIDIDDTICYFETALDKKNCNYHNVRPYYDRIEILNNLAKTNHIVMWTARGSGSGIDWSELTKLQLKGWNVKYHELRFGKPVFDIFIDDKEKNCGGSSGGPQLYKLTACLHP